MCAFFVRFFIALEEFSIEQFLHRFTKIVTIGVSLKITSCIYVFLESQSLLINAAKNYSEIFSSGPSCVRLKTVRIIGYFRTLAIIQVSGFIGTEP